MIYRVSNKKLITKLVEPFFVAVFWPVVISLTATLLGLPITQEVYNNTIIFSFIIFLIVLVVDILYVLRARTIELYLSSLGINFFYKKNEKMYFWNEISSIKVIKSKSKPQQLHILPVDEYIDVAAFDDSEKICLNIKSYCTINFIKFE